MYNEPIFLAPAFQDRIWGGSKLRTLFNYDIPNDHTGEAWIISAHKNGPSTVLNGSLKGELLDKVWKEHPELFGKEATSEDFPLLVKLLDANDNLSVQVHPDDAYARNEGEQYGKTECWYVVDAEPGAEIIYGHHALSKEEFRERVDSGEWDELLRSVKVKKGDFYYVPSGTIHGIGKGIVILETQQSSDITYRVYDYDRTDDQGNPRDLHIEQATEVTTFPHHDSVSERVTSTKEDLESVQLVEEEYFTVYHWQLSGSVSTPLKADYLLVSIIDGSGSITVDGQEFSLKKGDNFILPTTIENYVLAGDLEIIASHE